jgi:membrane-associated phospholipid phosphatase
MMLDIATIDTVARFFLGFSHLYLIIPMLVLGLIFLNKNLFYHALCIMLFSLVINIALKVTFQVPLAPFLNKAGFAFPSGHMQLATIVYGWFALKIPSTRLRVLIGLILVGVGFGLVYFGYHTVVDVLGGVFFASLLITFYAFMQFEHNKVLPWILITTSSLAMVYIAWRSTIFPHAWVAYCSLLVLIIPERLFLKGKSHAFFQHRK